MDYTIDDLNSKVVELQFLLKEEKPNWITITDVINTIKRIVEDIREVDLYAEEMKESHVNYCKHLWDNTFSYADNHRLSHVKNWYLKHVRDSSAKTITGFNNLRLCYKNHNLIFVDVPKNYYESEVTIRDIQYINPYHENFNLDNYKLTEAYIRKHCKLNEISGRFLVYPYLI